MLLALLVVGLGYTLHRCATLGVEYYDAYVYLNNASWMTGTDTVDYDVLRPPLLSLAQAPVVAVARAAGPANRWLLLGPHLESGVLTLLTVLAVFLLLRASCGRLPALLGAVLFVGTRYVVRYGAHVMADVPLAGLTAAAVALVCRAHQERRLGLYALAGVALGAAITMKYGAALLVPTLVVAELLLSVHRAGTGRYRSSLDGRRAAGLALTLAVGAALFAALHAALYRALYPHEPWTQFVTAMTSAKSVVERMPGESWTDHGAMAMVMLSPPLLLLVVLGLALAVLRPEPRDAPFFAWLAVMGGGLVFLVGHNEARYLLPVVPAAIYFALRATTEVARRLAESPRPALRRAGRVALAGFLALCLSGGVRQAWEDADPFFANDVQRRAAAALAGAARGQGRLFVLGQRHTLFPPTRGPVPEDEYWNTFHYDPGIAAYFLGRRLNTLSTRNDSAWNLRGALGILAVDGDAVLRLEDRFYTTRTLPTGRPHPFEVWSIRRADLLPAPGDRFVSMDGSLTGTVHDDAGGLTFVPDRTLGELWLFAKRAPAGQTEFLASVRLQADTPAVVPAASARDIAALTLLRVDSRLVE